MEHFEHAHSGPAHLLHFTVPAHTVQQHASIQPHARTCLQAGTALHHHAQQRHGYDAHGYGDQVLHERFVWLRIHGVKSNISQDSAINSSDQMKDAVIECGPELMELLEGHERLVA